jgi:hypothetical protein
MPAELKTLGWLSGADATSCAFDATKGYTCIDHTVCVDCLEEAKSLGQKCGPILSSSSKNHRHRLNPADNSPLMAPEWICTTHRDHRAAAANAASAFPCACDCHLDTGESACKLAADKKGRGRKGRKVKPGPKPKGAPISVSIFNVPSLLCRTRLHHFHLLFVQLAPKANRRISGGFWSQSMSVLIKAFCKVPDSTTHLCGNCLVKWERNLESAQRQQYRNAMAGRPAAAPAAALPSSIQALQVWEGIPTPSQTNKPKNSSIARMRQNGDIVAKLTGSPHGTGLQHTVEVRALTELNRLRREEGVFPSTETVTYLVSRLPLLPIGTDPGY